VCTNILKLAQLFQAFRVKIVYCTVVMIIIVFMIIINIVLTL
jgi:hypothetical protein